MVRTPIIFVILAVAAPAHAAPSADGTRGWKIDAGGALSMASRAYRAIDRGDVAAMAEDMQGPRMRNAVDPSRIGLGTVETGDRRSGDAIARISARLSF